MSLQAIKTLDYTILACRDLPAMRRFYRDIMGLTITYERDDWIKFQLGEIALALRPLGKPFFPEAETVSGSTVQLAFRVTYDQVDVCYKELVAKRVPILDPPRDQVWGHRTLYFADPEGNVLEIYAES